MILADTAVLVYALGTPHRLRDPCRGLLRAAQDGLVRLVTTPEVIQEFAHIRARRRSRSDATADARQYALALAPLVEVTADDLAEGLRLFESVIQLGCFDAVLAATARRRALPLASPDSALRAVPDLVVLDPANDDFMEEVRSVG